LVKGEYAESQVNQDFTSSREKWCDCFDCFKLKKIWKMTLEHDLEKIYMPEIADAIERVQGEIGKSEMQINFYRQFSGSIEKSLYFFRNLLRKISAIETEQQKSEEGILMREFFGEQESKENKEIKNKILLKREQKIECKVLEQWTEFLLEKKKAEHKFNILFFPKNTSSQLKHLIESIPVMPKPHNLNLSLLKKKLNHIREILKVSSLG
jgi:hypothetical protein